MPDDTGTQYAGLTLAERVLAQADDHMSTCDEPQMVDCETCTRRIGKYRKYLGVLADAGLLVQPHTGPRAWAMPGEPGPEVKAVRNGQGARFVREHADPEDLWRYAPPHRLVHGTRGVARPWRLLVAEQDELTDATAEVLPNGD